MKFLKYWGMGIAVVLLAAAILGFPIGFLWLGCHLFGDVSLFVTTPLLVGGIIGITMIGDN